MHDVRAGETLYYIARHYGVTVESIEAANPGLSAQTLRAGSVIRIPTTMQQSTSPAQPHAQAEAINVAVILPLSASGVEGERSIEFYREKLNEEKFNSTVERIRQNGTQMIVGPVYPDHFPKLSALARQHHTRLVIPFYSKAVEVNTNPYVYLVNTPDKFEQEFTAELLMKSMKNVNVAFMHVGTSDNKQPLTQYLRTRLLARGYSVTEFSYDAPLEQMKSATNDSKPTLIIPDASDNDALAKVLAKIEGFKKYYPERALRLFAYGNWIENQSPATLNRLHAADAYVCTSSYCNLYDPVTQAFNEAYVRAYGEEPLTVTPRMGLLGYDVALHMLTGISRYGADFTTQASGAPLLQTMMRFNRIEQGGGLVNNSLFFIHLRTDGQIERLAMKR